MRIRFITSILLALWLSPHMAGAQQIAEAEKRQVVDSVARRLEEDYLFADLGAKMADMLRNNYRSGGYRAIHSPVEFASRLTTELQGLSRDRHLRVFFDPEWVATTRKGLSAADSLAFASQEQARFKSENYAFSEIKVLPGNIGYLKLDGMMDIRDGGQTGIAAMNFLAHTDALILDFRENRGGANMGTLLASYLFDGEPVQLAELHLRKGNKVLQEWTMPYVPGSRMPKIPVYILTSKLTFSAAEAVAQRLKVLGRALTVGEQTGGGAHVTEQQIATERFTVFVPFGRSIGDPAKDTDWEGVGVVPDVRVESAAALDRAYVMALEKLSAGAREGAVVNYRWFLASALAKSKPFVLDQIQLSLFAGKYGELSLVIDQGVLYFQQSQGARHSLIAMDATTFVVSDIPYLRIRVNLEQGRVTGLTRLYENGSSRVSARSN